MTYNYNTSEDLESENKEFQQKEEYDPHQLALDSIIQPVQDSLNIQPIEAVDIPGDYAEEDPSLQPSRQYANRHPGPSILRRRRPQAISSEPEEKPRVRFEQPNPSVYLAPSQSQQGTDRWIFILIAAIVLALGLWYIIGSDSSEKSDKPAYSRPLPPM